MIGVFNYFVFSIYFSLIFSIIGLAAGFNGKPKIAVIFLLLSALSTFIDTKINNKNNNMSTENKKFVKEIKALGNMIAFGILPIVIGLSTNLYTIWYISVYIIYGLLTMIRISYINSIAKTNIGLPEILVSLICPILFLIRKSAGFCYLYPITLLLLAVLYISKFKTPKPNKYIKIASLLIGLVEFILLIVLK